MVHNELCLLFAISCCIFYVYYCKDLPINEGGQILPLNVLVYLLDQMAWLIPNTECLRTPTRKYQILNNLQSF